MAASKLASLNGLNMHGSDSDCSKGCSESPMPRHSRNTQNHEVRHSQLYKGRGNTKSHSQKILSEGVITRYCNLQAIGKIKDGPWLPGCGGQRSHKTVRSGVPLEAKVTTHSFLYGKSAKGLARRGSCTLSVEDCGIGGTPKQSRGSHQHL